MNKSKWNPCNIPTFHFFSVFQRHCARSEIARISIVFSAFYEEVVKIIVGYNRFAANNKMSFISYFCRNAVYSLSQMSYVGAYVSVSASHEFLQSALVVCCNESKSVEFPRNPDRFSFSPFHDVFSFFSLCK